MSSETFHVMACSECDTPLLRGVPNDGDYPADGALRQPTPLLRMTALAREQGIVTTDIPAADAAGLAGAIGLGVDEAGRLRALVGLADDLGDDLRTDVLAFALAMFVGDLPRLKAEPANRIGIGRERLPSAPGVGHLAFHMAYGCGRDTSSATFALVPLPDVQ